MYFILLYNEQSYITVLYFVTTRLISQIKVYKVTYTYSSMKS